ncbi:hypothetical protein NAV33_07540 [Pseudomonas stutzeri]|uniref:hypothetical protein n=1 Tax=Stutzerimonas stutzeri TaxID=316 RepID=UPI00210AB455|nr:hypothetical protein [Stutzerimonas stutzeri]MCQ4311747.1 hypothetical protein [Stutzerimonas stutzeri]
MTAMTITTRGIADVLFICGDQETALTGIEVLLSETMPGTFEMMFGSVNAKAAEGADRVCVELPDRYLCGPITFNKSGSVVFSDEGLE